MVVDYGKERCEACNQEILPFQDVEITLNTGKARHKYCPPNLPLKPMDTSIPEVSQAEPAKLDEKKKKTVPKFN